MVNSGTEATMSAIRLARGHTGRDKIIKFAGCYHGHVDSLLVQAGSGGFAEAVVRIMAALAHAGTGVRRQSLEAYETLAEKDARLAHLHDTVLSQMIKTQSCILDAAPEAALSGLNRLLPDPDDRQSALAIASAVMIEEAGADKQVVRMRDTMAAILGIQ